MELSKQFLEKFNQWSEDCLKSELFNKPLLFKSGGILISLDKKGNKIHIKKVNRGKFTESANRAGMGVQEFARHVLANKNKYSSTLVKRANFARNARKWKHEDGGTINGVRFINKTHNTPSVTDTNQDMANYSLKLLKRKKKK